MREHAFLLEFLKYAEPQLLLVVAVRSLVLEIAVLVAAVPVVGAWGLVQAAESRSEALVSTVSVFLFPSLCQVASSSVRLN